MKLQLDITSNVADALNVDVSNRGKPKHVFSIIGSLTSGVAGYLALEIAKGTSHLTPELLDDINGTVAHLLAASSLPGYNKRTEELSVVGPVLIDLEADGAILKARIVSGGWTVKAKRKPKEEEAQEAAPAPTPPAPPTPPAAKKKPAARKAKSAASGGAATKKKPAAAKKKPAARKAKSAAPAAPTAPAIPPAPATPAIPPAPGTQS